VLVAVLAVVVVLVLLVSISTKLLETRLEMARQAKSQASDIAIGHGKINELTYLLATQRHTAAGVSTGENPQGTLRNEDGFFILPLTGDEVRLDGFSYRVSPRLSFSLQNTSGLIAINSADAFWLSRWLQAKGVNYFERNKLSQILHDWADENDWQQPAGAEHTTYEANGLLSPSNYLFQHCGELHHLIDWGAVLSQHSDFVSECALHRSPVLNLNAVPLHLWQDLFPNSVKTIEAQRNQGAWFISDSSALNTEPALLNISDQYFSTLINRGTLVSVITPLYQKTVLIELGVGNLKPFVRKIQ
jgi:hypothetical protein